MLDLKVISSLEKVLPKRECSVSEIKELSCLEGEKVSFQLAFSADSRAAYNFSVTSDSDIEIKTYFVENVPVEYTTFTFALEDENYISHEAGIYPDRLMPADRDWVQASEIYKSIWVTVKANSGVHNLKIKFNSFDNKTIEERTIKLNVLPVKLTEQKLIFTQWFHTDCISEYYGYESYSEEHWVMIEKFLRMASDNGINMILTPIFTQPLDTEVGRKRPSCQLLKIVKNGNSYSFDFSRFERWISLCKKIGIEYFEMPHLFTQWGARFTPRIIAEINGEEKDIFGWDVASDSKEYDEFLGSMLPELIEVLKQNGIFDKTYFHISDEPALQHLEAYSKAREIAKKYLGGCKIIDALSDYDFYKNGVVKIPIPSTDHIKPFLEADLEERWTYYCCMQCKGVSNRFLTMPSARNRSIGIQLYKYHIDGFLHWGYNFYYSQFSRMVINPFAQTDAYNGFPAGDSFSVYPAKDGAVPAISLIVFNEALQDMRALQLLESYIGYEKTVELVEEALGEEVTFDSCYSAEAILKMREAVNKRISKESK
ncbi:MAG: DUF4091 domain-containing protein [Clostridia bacterium]|nr:DUF4091 domain-containing protein [Clostridia bacterium]